MTKFAKNSRLFHNENIGYTFMTQIIKYTICIALLTIILLCPAGSMAQSIDSQFPKHEVRAVWLTTISGLDWPKKQVRSAADIEKQKKELTSILDNLKRANINTVLFQTRIRGSVVYPSAIEPWDICLTGTSGKNPGYDPLRFAVEECHKRGMEAHAWIVCIPVGKWNSPACKALRRKYPSMISRDKEEGYINPANTQAATYISGICTEIVKNYDVDGIQLDYIRYPETIKVKEPKAKARENITRIVRSVYADVKSIKPWVKISCSPIGKLKDLSRYSSRGWNAFNRGYQDVEGWMEEGIMDQVYPMMYFKGNNFHPFAIDWKERSNGRTIVGGLGTYQLAPSQANWDMAEVQRQLHTLRAIGAGHAHFRSRFLTDDTKGIYRYTSDAFNPYPALVPPMTWQCSETPVTPSHLKAETGDKCTSLTWSYDKNIREEQIKYNVYASADWPVDTENPKNIISTGLDKPQITLPFGNDDRSMYYAVTAVNRYGIESKPCQSHEKATDAKATSISAPYITIEESVISTKKYMSKVLDAEYIVVESLEGNQLMTFPFKGQDISTAGINDGIYILRSLNRKGVSHRLGFILIDKQNIIH